MKTRLMLAALFALAMTGGCTGTGQEREENEVQMKLEEVPAAVKATLTKEAQGAQIGEVEMEREGGQNVYEASVMIDGKPWEIEVAEDGRLISKEQDDD